MDSCEDCTSKINSDFIRPGEFVCLTNDIINYSGSDDNTLIGETCIRFLKSGIGFSCEGNKIVGDGDEWGYGIKLEKNKGDNQIINCPNISRFQTCIVSLSDGNIFKNISCFENSGGHKLRFYNSNFNYLENIYLSNSSLGFYFWNSSNNNFNNSFSRGWNNRLFHSNNNLFYNLTIISDDSWSVFQIQDSSGNIFEKLKIKDAYTGFGFSDNSTYNQIKDSLLIDVAYVAGFFVYEPFNSYPHNNIFWNNYFKRPHGYNKVIQNEVISPYENYWNTTLNCTSGPNIIGGPCIGGNYWTDFGEICSDLEKPYGICDENYTLQSRFNEGEGISQDYLPLTGFFSVEGASIRNPRNNSGFDKGESIFFFADYLGETPSSIDYHWSSDLDGFLGSTSDNYLIVNNLSEGKHTITVIITITEDMIVESFTDSIIVNIIPDSFDWRDYKGQNWMTSVKNQGQCGSCSAFSSLGVMESKYNIEQDNPNLNIDLSEQYLVSDCCSSVSCSGGWSNLVFEYLFNSGVSSEECHSYLAMDNSCPDFCEDSSPIEFWNISSFDFRSYKTKTDLKNHLIDKGPMNVYLKFAGTHTKKDSKGCPIYLCNTSTIDHSVVLVGYDNDYGHWIIKNSWGFYQGDPCTDGYFSMDFDTCPFESINYGGALYLEGVNSPT